MNLSKKLLVAMCMSAIGGTVFAGTVSISPSTATALQAGGATSPTPHVIQYAPEAADETGNIQGRLIYDQAILTPTLTAMDPVCSNPVPGLILIVTQNNTVAPLPAGPLCSIAFTAVAAAPLGVTNLDLQFDAGAGDGCFENTAGNPTTCTLVDATVEIVDAPPTPLTLSYAPVPGPITLPPGNAGATVSTNIVATAAGNAGTASLTCTAAAGFTVTPSLNFAGAGSQDIAVGCTLGASQTSGAITCTEIDGDTPAPGAARTWTATCPQGGVVPVNPTITTVTPPGAFAMPSGAPGQTVTRPIQFSAAGGAGTGSATIACTATAPVTVAPANQTVTGSAQPAPVNVSIPLTSAAQGPFAVTCVVTDSAGARTDVFDVSAPAGSALPPPSVVPASSLWSQLALIALLAGLGMAVVGFRRS